jgi:hypothetical protein
MTSLTKKILYSAILTTAGLFLIAITFFGLFGIGPLVYTPTFEFFGALGIIFLIGGVVVFFYNNPNDFYISRNSDPDAKYADGEPKQIERGLPPTETIDDELGGLLGWGIGRGKP